METSDSLATLRAFVLIVNFIAKEPSSTYQRAVVSSWDTNAECGAAMRGFNAGDAFAQGKFPGTLSSPSRRYYLVCVPRQRAAHYLAPPPLR